MKNRLNFRKLFMVIFAISLSIFLSSPLTSCSNARETKGDLSFGGITIGKSFPDSLKADSLFKFFNEYDVPFYEGALSFSLPKNKKTKFHVVATTNLENTEVTCIEITPTELEAWDLYDMLKSKYGLPISDFGDTDCSLQYLMSHVYKQLGYSAYETTPDISGTYILAEWNPSGYTSKILLIADIYHFPSEYNPKISTYLRLKYINPTRVEEVDKQAKSKKQNSKRDSYKKTNSEVMNQDF